MAELYEQLCLADHLLNLYGPREVVQAAEEQVLINPFHPDCETIFSRILTIFFPYFPIFKTPESMIVIPNSHLVLQMKHFKQHFEK